MKFPAVEATNLLREKLTLPCDFLGHLNILIIPFHQWHQARVDSWMPFLRELEKTNPILRYYELPTIYKMNFVSRTFLNEGMRAGIPDRTARERTVTLYVDKPQFRQALEITDEEDITIVLSDREGNVYWSERGVFTPEKAEKLISQLKNINHAPL